MQINHKLLSEVENLGAGKYHELSRKIRCYKSYIKTYNEHGKLVCSDGYTIKGDMLKHWIIQLERLFLSFTITKDYKESMRLTSQSFKTAKKVAKDAQKIDKTWVLNQLKNASTENERQFIKMIYHGILYDNKV